MTPIYPKKGAIAGQVSNDDDDMVKTWFFRDVPTVKIITHDCDGTSKQSPNTEPACLYKFVDQHSRASLVSF